ncbi:MAG: alanine racemase [Chloroflexota bacterium]
MTTDPGRRQIEERLAGAGLPALPRMAWLELDLDALRGNLTLLRDLAGPGVPVRPVVKADAYGHGAVPIALALQAAGVDGLCVAAFDEALELRAAGVTAPILVLYPVPPAAVADAARLGIAVAGGAGATLAAIVRAAAACDPARPLAVELEVETGLGRGGVVEAELVEAARLVAAAPGVVLTGVWTHLQAVEDEATTATQIIRFDSTVAALRAAGIPLPPRHAAASAGLLTGDVLPYDGIRPGLALYGLLPDEIGAASVRPGVIAGLRPVLSLLARPVRVADLPAGWGIGYGPTFRTERPSRIATLPLGYGDGWSRALANRASAIVRGHRVPLVGNVSMDALTADVTDVPGSPVVEDDEFVLLGAAGTERITAADLAQERNTNSWEVVTAMARRLPRVYHAAAGPVGLRTLTEPRA